MFKKLKDKLAEEVKNSPQKIQQFAQAAQAAVTSASSSISDITNHDLFSIGENDSKQNASGGSSGNNNPDVLRDLSLAQPTSLNSNIDYLSRDGTPTNETVEGQRHRKLSNSSFASDVSFKLPFYDSPAMYHMQSDMEVSASEAEERGLSSSGMSLERVTKEQLYGAYRRTQDRYSKYRTRYADLARHYKLLERENAKARSVLVETQDKALRRISELREQCSLEQSAKAHLERALREEIDEKNMKIDSLNTKITLLQNNTEDDEIQSNNNENNDEPHLIDLSTDNAKPDGEAEILVLKIQKMEQLITKYKESLKIFKEKNSQLAGEHSVLINDYAKLKNVNEQLQVGIKQLTEARQQIQELNEENEDLRNKLNAFEFNKSKEISSKELDIKHYQEQISKLQSKIEVFTKREEEYAISLAENKLSIHKELEEKEAEIKSLKGSLSASKNEIKSLEIVMDDYKKTIKKLEEDNDYIKNKLSDLNSSKNKLSEVEDQIQQLKKNCQMLESSKAKAIEEVKCLELQLKQEMAEKLAMIDRNNYLQTRNDQILEENTTNIKQISELEKKLYDLQQKVTENEIAEDKTDHNLSNAEIIELNEWKTKYFALESEIQEERIELVKLQTEIDKLLANHESTEAKNVELNSLVEQLQLENSELLRMKLSQTNILETCENVLQILSVLKKNVVDTSLDIKAVQKEYIHDFETVVIPSISKAINDFAYKNDNLLQEKELEFHQITSALTELNDLHNIVSNELNNTKSFNEKLEANNNSYKEQILKLEECNKNLLTENKLLNEKATQIVAVNQNIESSLNELQNGYSDLQKQNLFLMLKLENLDQEKSNELDSEKIIISNRISELENKIEALLNDLEQSLNEKSKIQKQLTDNENELTNKEIEINRYEDELCNFKEQLKRTVDDNNLLHEKCERLKQEKEEFHEKTLSLDQKLVEYEGTIEEQKKLLNEIEPLNLKIVKTENELQFLRHENDRLSKINADLLANLTNTTEDTKNILKSLELSNAELKSEFDTLNREYTILVNENKTLKDSLEHLQKYAKDDKNDLENTVQRLKQDFLSQSEEMLRVQTSLKNSSDQNLANDKQIAHLKQVESNYKEQNESLLLKIDQETEAVKDAETKYISLLTEYKSLKENNKRMASDIEGLQQHLMKVSKDNSELNDKLREVITNNETWLPNNVTPSNSMAEISDEIEHLKFNNQKQLEKIEDLERQNSILAEENFELQDQLKLQNVSKNNDHENPTTEKELELHRLKDKHDIILTQKNQLEKNFTDLEYTNSSCLKNIQHLEEKNQKLSLSHEKLERRLDEALVSLRHLRALEENTELEYLRNILYEYLTGSGTHALTLAKVLSAVVKFDDRQTQTVLQREKERQGLMVRHYIRKKAKTYSISDLLKAVEDVRNKKINSYQASELYGIPRSTIITRLYETRPMNVQPGRPTVLPQEVERRMAENLHVMEKYGFPLTRKEVIILVSEYIRQNGIITPFKNDIPGQDWFRGFQKRNNLSIKKPQPVEIARKNACNPFTVYGYFDILEKEVKKLGLTYKPEQIYNLDETSICSDPTKGKIVGKKGFRSTRTTSGPGRENTTVLLAANACGGKIPPLIIFQAKHLWSEWFYKNDSINTAYAVSKKGWMETSIFEKYLRKIFVPAIGNIRPVLLIFDGHSTHVDLNIIEYAASEGITILKLPPHSSHILQPLDCSTMKPLKDRWEDEIIKWQRLHIGSKLPKNEFAKILTEIWDKMNPVIIQNGFRRTGAYPVNSNVIPKNIFDVIIWKKWELCKNTAPSLFNLALKTINELMSREGPIESMTQNLQLKVNQEIQRKKDSNTKSETKDIMNKNKKPNNEPNTQESIQYFVENPKTIIKSEEPKNPINLYERKKNEIKIQNQHIYEVPKTTTESQPINQKNKATYSNKDENVSIVKQTIEKKDIVLKEAGMYKFSVKNPCTYQLKLPDKKNKSQLSSSLHIINSETIQSDKISDGKIKDLNITFEELLLKSVARNDPPKKPKKRISNSDAEVLTYKNVIERMRKEKEEMEEKKKRKQEILENKKKKKEEKENKKHEKLKAKKAQTIIKNSKEPKTKLSNKKIKTKTNNPKKQKTQIPKNKKCIKEKTKQTKKVSDTDSNTSGSYKTLDSSEDEDVNTFFENILCGTQDSDDDVSISRIQNALEDDSHAVKKRRTSNLPSNNFNISSFENPLTSLRRIPQVGKFILVKFTTNKGKKTYKYVCLIEDVIDKKIVIQGLKSYKKQKTVFRVVENDNSIIDEGDIIHYLPDPEVIGNQYIFPHEIDVMEL